MADHPSHFNNRASPPQSREENQNRQEPLSEENRASLDNLSHEIRMNIMRQAMRGGGIYPEDRAAEDFFTAPWKGYPLE